MEPDMERKCSVDVSLCSESSLVCSV